VLPTRSVGLFPLFVYPSGAPEGTSGSSAGGRRRQRYGSNSVRSCTRYSCFLGECAGDSVANSGRAVWRGRAPCLLHRLFPLRMHFVVAQERNALACWKRTAEVSSYMVDARVRRPGLLPFCRAAWSPSRHTWKACAHTKSPDVGGGCWVRRPSPLHIDLHPTLARAAQCRTALGGKRWRHARGSAAVRHLPSRPRAALLRPADGAGWTSRGQQLRTGLYALADAFAPAKLYACGLPQAYGPPTVNASLLGSSRALHSRVASAQRGSWVPPTVCAAPINTAMTCTR